jgi:hypothetical protein
MEDMVMNLFHKVRVLVGALAHKPFTPRPESRSTDSTESPGQAGENRAAPPELTQQQPGVEDAERVADLIAQKRRNEGG